MTQSSARNPNICMDCEQMVLDDSPSVAGGCAPNVGGDVSSRPVYARYFHPHQPILEREDALSEPNN